MVYISIVVEFIDIEVHMLDFDKFRYDIIEFMCEDTLEAIDWGVLDLRHNKNRELKEILFTLETALTLELENNYKNNTTGIFRVSREDQYWCYEENDIRIKAENLRDLKRMVKSQNRIWYVFDRELGGRCVKLKRTG